MRQETGSNTPQTANKVSIQLSLDGHSFSAQALAGDFPGDGAVEVELLTARTMLVPREVFDAGLGTELLAAGRMALAAGENAVHNDLKQEFVAELAPAASECAVHSTPQQEITAGLGAELLAAAGLAPADGECVEHNDLKQKVTAELSVKLLAAAGLPPTESECVVHSDLQQEVVAVMAANAEAVAAVTAKFGGRARYTTPLLGPVETTAPTVWMRHTGELLYIKVWDGGLRFAGVVPATSDADLLYACERLGQEFTLEELVLHIAQPAGKRLRKLLKPYFRQIVCE